jgi:hypothetical protein
LKFLDSARDIEDSTGLGLGFSTDVIDDICYILHHNKNLSHVTLMLIFPKTFSFLVTLNSANHGHNLTRKLALLFFIAKQVLERKTMNFRFKITNFGFSTTNFTMRQIHLTHLGTPAIKESPTEPSTCTTLSASAASSTSNKSGKKIPSSY